MHYQIKNKMETKKVKSISLSEEQVAKMKQRIIEHGMRKYILFNVATKKRIYEVTKEYVFPWAELEVENVDDTNDIVWVTMTGDLKIPFNFVWEKSQLGTTYRLAKVL